MLNIHDINLMKRLFISSNFTLLDVVGNRGLPWFMFFAFLVKKTSGILFFGPSFRKPARKASLGEIYLKNKDLYDKNL